MQRSGTNIFLRSKHYKCVACHDAPMCQIWGHSAIACHWMPGADVFWPDRVDGSGLVRSDMVKIKQTLWIHGSQGVPWHGAPMCQIWGHSMTVRSFDSRKQGVPRPKTLYLGCMCTMQRLGTNIFGRSKHYKCVACHGAPVCQI